MKHQQAAGVTAAGPQGLNSLLTMLASLAHLWLSASAECPVATVHAHNLTACPPLGRVVGTTQRSDMPDVTRTLCCIPLTLLDSETGSKLHN